MKRRDQIPPLESGLYVAIAHPANALLLRGCALITPYRAGFEDCLYARIYANPFQVGTVAWSQYDHGNQDARVSLKGESYEKYLDTVACTNAEPAGQPASAGNQ